LNTETPNHAMQAFRRTAIRYWERRRIVYNLALLPPAILSYGFVDNLNWVGDPHETHYSYILPWFALSALGANVCYSFAYAVEFLFGSDDPASRWMRYGRTTTFVGGVLFAMLLAIIGGRNIADMDWYHGFKHPGNSSFSAVFASLRLCV
jgi:hypothetical protein